jgi:DNA-binding CsgD family transcriptional regulator
MAAGGIVLASRLRNKYRSEIFSILLYFQVFIFTFGFYGIWGQVVITSFLSPYISGDLLMRITNISILLGLPFLIFAWLMLVQFSGTISGRRKNNWLIFWFLLINFAVIFVAGLLIARTSEINPAVLIKYYFIFMNCLYSVIAAGLLLFPVRKKSVIHDYDGKVTSLAIIFAMLAQITPLLFYESQVYLGLIFVFTFFAGNTFLPVYLTYGTLLTVFSEEGARDLSFEEFCRKFEISARETDIIREICNGLSNKEISDKLFISLQTVKDHTHRIYIKTNVKSRVQLINIVKEMKRL